MRSREHLKADKEQTPKLFYILYVHVVDMKHNYSAKCYHSAVSARRPENLLADSEIRLAFLMLSPDLADSLGKFLPFPG
jgi:hypothetical protein